MGRGHRPVGPYAGMVFVPDVHLAADGDAGMARVSASSRVRPILFLLPQMNVKLAVQIFEQTEMKHWPSSTMRRTAMSSGF